MVYTSIYQTVGRGLVMLACTWEGVTSCLTSGLAMAPVDESSCPEVSQQNIWLARMWTHLTYGPRIWMSLDFFTPVFFSSLIRN